MASPRVWVLLDDRPGHRTQVLGLADRLGWAYETRSLAFNGISQVPNGILGARTSGLDKTRSESLAPPYPDLVIAMGRRCVPVARWIRRASGGAARLVQLGRKGLVAPDDFALQICCAHFNLPPHDRRMAVALPPTQVTAQRLAEARAAWEGLLNDAEKPHAVLLVGGETAHHLFTPSQAADLAKRAEAAAEKLGGKLTVVTSRRTSEPAIAAMREAAKQADFHLWRKDEAKNPYLGYLAWADLLIVTGESESMVAEAAAAAKPLHIAALEPKPLTGKGKLARWMTAEVARRGPLAPICRKLFNAGWITPYRDLEMMHRVLYDAGFARPIDGALSLDPPRQDSAMDEISERLHRIFDPRGSGS